MGHVTSFRQIALEDFPRARRSDPLTSHAAADRSQQTITGIRAGVLALIREEGPLIGSDLNATYQERWSSRGWQRAAWDSPRKRAGELLADGFLQDTGRGGAETEYELTLTGLEVV